MNRPAAGTSIPPLHQDYLLAVLDGTIATYRTSAKDAIWRAAHLNGLAIAPDFRSHLCSCPICNPKPPPTDEELGTRAKWTARKRRGAWISLKLVRLPQSVLDATRDPECKGRVAYLIDHCRSCNTVLWIPVVTQGDKEVAA